MHAQALCPCVNKYVCMCGCLLVYVGVSNCACVCYFVCKHLVYYWFIAFTAYCIDPETYRSLCLIFCLCVCMCVCVCVRVFNTGILTSYAVILGQNPKTRL